MSAVHYDIVGKLESGMNTTLKILFDKLGIDSSHYRHSGRNSNDAHAKLKMHYQVQYLGRLFICLSYLWKKKWRLFFDTFTRINLYDLILIQDGKQRGKEIARLVHDIYKSDIYDFGYTLGF